MKAILCTMLLACATFNTSAQTNSGTGTEQENTAGTAKLADIKVHGKTVNKFNKDKFVYTYDVFYQDSKDYKESCIVCTTIPGDSSKVEISYNPATRIADINVSAIVGNAKNTYKIYFSKMFHQLEDGGFEKYTSGNEPLYGWHSFASATGQFAKLSFLSPQPESIEGGANGSKHAVKIVSKNLGLAKANGNLTTGAINMGSTNPTDASNYNYTVTDSISNNLKFGGKPDSVIFYAKFKAGEGNIDKCGNANFILHKKGRYQDPEIESQKALFFGKASSPIKESEDWVRYSVPFEYQENAKGSPTYLLASVTTNPNPGQSFNDTLYFDEVKFIYNHKLTSLHIKGAEFEFHTDTLHYDLRGSHYFADKKSIAYTTNSQGAQVIAKFNKATGLYTFDVKGSDYSTNKESITTYTVQFDLPDTLQVDGISVFGKPFADFSKKKNTYVVMNQDYEEGCISVEYGNQEHTSVDIAYDPATRCANITLTALKGGEQSHYRVKFSQALYQFEDASFENYTEGLEPLYGWNSFNSATGVMAGFGKGLSPNPASVEDGANDSKRSVMLHSKNVLVANANGNLTTGIINMGNYQPTDASNHNFTAIDSVNNAFRFAGRPDSVIFYAKFKAAQGNSAKVGRAQFILHDKCNYKDPEDDSQIAHRIGKASQLIAESKEWKKYVVPFAYDKEQTEDQYLLASVTTNPIPGESAGDTLYFDEVTFIYNHALTSIAVSEPGMEGEVFEIADGVFDYDLTEHIYNPELCYIEVDGAGATMTQVYNEETGVLTVTVKGSDFVVNPNSVSTYTFKFNPVPTGIESIESTNGHVNVYDVNGRLIRKNVKAATALQGLPLGVYIVNGKKVVK